MAQILFFQIFSVLHILERNYQLADWCFPQYSISPLDMNVIEEWECHFWIDSTRGPTELMHWLLLSFYSNVYSKELVVNLFNKTTMFFYCQLKIWLCWMICAILKCYREKSWHIGSQTRLREFIPERILVKSANFV